jgi:hypothetical protein
MHQSCAPILCHVDETADDTLSRVCDKMSEQARESKEEPAEYTHNASNVRVSSSDTAVAMP